MKKFVSLLLVFAVVAAMVCAFAVNVSAEGESQTDDPGITWELSEDGKTLTFTGEGAMPDYNIATFEGRPWHHAAETVTTVQINPGITALGDYAFFHFEKLTNVSIPSSVQSIGESAFSECTGLTSIIIPSSVKSIGDIAFNYCTSLESVTIPSGVTSIGNGAFASCSSLKSVTISYGVTGIGDGMFNNCTNLTSVTIPSSVTGIGDNAFEFCSSLTSITIPYGVKSIDNNAFKNCKSLESISFPSSITNIGKAVFQRCSNLTSITLKTKTTPDWMTLRTTFDQNAKSKLYIPDGTSEDYEGGDWRRLFSNKRAKEAYVVDDQPGENGTITFDKDTFPTETYAEPNETVTVTVMPATGYLLKADSLSAVAENGEAIALTQDETDPMKYTFTMPCSNVTVKAEFEACEHPESEWVVETEATCITEGMRFQRCKDCGKVLASEAISATAAHTAGEWEITPATCGEAGKEILKCTVCDEVIEEKVIPATGEHSFDTTKWCYDENYHWYAPTCGCEVKGSYGEHDWVTTGFLWLAKTKCRTCEVEKDAASGSTLSGGNLWIVIAGAVVLVGGIVAAVVVVKKKKKPAVAGGEKE